MKASELSRVFQEMARVVEPGYPRDALRFLSSALSQLPPSKAAAAALKDLAVKLEGVSQPAEGVASFGDLATSLRPLAVFAQSAGSKAAKESVEVLTQITERHRATAVKVSEELLAPVAPARVKKPAPPPNASLVARHVTALTRANAGTEEFGAALVRLNGELDAKLATVSDLKAIAAELRIPRPGATRAKLLSAISREHDTILETLRKVNSGAVAG